MTTGISRSKNLNYLFQKLSRSRFRSRFRLGLKEINYIHTKGIEAIKEHAYTFIQQRLAPAQPKNDGKQTPMSGHPVFLAQHATATCCRNCLKKWHAIPKGQALRSNEIGYIVNVIMCWIKIQQKTYQSPSILTSWFRTMPSSILLQKARRFSLWKGKERWQSETTFCQLPFR